MSAAGGPVVMGGMMIYPDTASLPEELQCYVRDAGAGLRVFHHPFCIQILPIGLPDRIEAHLSARLAEAEDALRKEGVEAYLWRLEKPYRLNALHDAVQAGSFDDDPKAYWKLLGRIWMDSDIEEDAGVWGALLAVELPGKYAMTEPGARKRLAEKGEVLRVYRGVQAPDEIEARNETFSGYSWTLDRGVAVKFANRMIAAPDLAWVAQADVPAMQVQAYLTGRGEEEVVIAPEDIDDIDDVLLLPAEEVADDYCPLNDLL